MSALRAGAAPVARLAAGLAVASLACAGLTGSAWAQDVDGLVVRKGPLPGDQYLAGVTVDVHGRVDGDLAMLGVQAGLDGICTGDVLAAGAVVHVGGIVGDDVRVLGGQVTVQGSVGDGLPAAGGEILVTPNTAVGGRALLAGRRVLAHGDFHGGLLAAGEHVELRGDVRGGARILSDDVEVGPRARLDGDLVVVGRNPPRIADGARISGTVSVEAPPGSGGAGRLRAALGGAAMQVGMLLVVWAWLVLAPGLARRAAILEWRRTTFDVGIGVAVALGLPLAAALLAASVVGLPLAAGVLSVWGLALLLGWAATAACLGEWLRARLRPASGGLGPRLAFALVALLVIRAGVALPWVGWAVAAGALLAGTGAVARAVQEAHGTARLSRGRPGPGAA